MLRALAIILAIMTLTFLGGLWLPWWVLALVAGLLGFLLNPGALAGSLFGFAGGFLLWGGLAWYRDTANDHILSLQIGQLFQGLTPVAVVLVSALIGGLTGALGGWTGVRCRQLFQTR